MLAPKMTRSELTKKWAPVLDDEHFGELKNRHKRRVVASLLENQSV